jgi:hypothetical protein
MQAPIFRAVELRKNERKYTRYHANPYEQGILIQGMQILLAPSTAIPESTRTREICCPVSALSLSTLDQSFRSSLVQ